MISISAMNDFFDFEKPCPKEIRKCKQLRTQYKLDTSGKNCGGCGSRLIKNIYIDKIKNN